jgi:hypothetical protein
MFVFTCGTCIVGHEVSEYFCLLGFTILVEFVGSKENTGWWLTGGATHVSKLTGT